jgi:hypothetical protein
VPQPQEASCRRLPMSTIPANSSRCRHRGLARRMMTADAKSFRDRALLRRGTVAHPEAELIIPGKGAIT